MLFSLRRLGLCLPRPKDATRLTMELDVSGKAVHPLLQALHQWAVRFVSENQLLGGVSAEDIAKQYHP